MLIKTRFKPATAFRPFSSSLMSEKKSLNSIHSQCFRIQRQQATHNNQPFYQQTRSASTTTSWIGRKMLTLPNMESSTHGQNQQARLANYPDDIQHVVSMVQSYDPVSTLPGFLLPTNTLKLSYFTIRSFWVETGLRKQMTSSYSNSNSSSSTSFVAPAEQHLNWWQDGIDTIYAANQETTNEESINHSTLRLIDYLVNVENLPLSKVHFDTIIQARKLDLDTKQYSTVDDLIHHVGTMSCGSLFSLMLEAAESGLQVDTSSDKIVYNFGVGHGITNSLRLSIPIISSTGKLIIPEDLCLKHDIKSPRYLLSALGQGDLQCKLNLQNAVEELTKTARTHIQQGKESLEACYEDSNDEKLLTEKQIFLPILASETFLDRLQSVDYDLTNRSLRNVSWMEHAQCAWKMISNSMSSK